MPFQSEKQKKWMWANKPEMAREWTSKYGSKIEAKKGTMAKKDKNWIQKATKNMRKDKPCTGKKFGGPTCPPGSKRYNLAKTFRKMNKPKKAFLGKMFRKSSTATPSSQSSSGGSSGMGGLLRQLLESKKHLFNKAGGGPIKADSGKWITVKNPLMHQTQHMRKKTEFSKTTPWIKKKEKTTTPWIKKKEKTTPWIKKKEKVGGEAKGGTYTPGWKPHLSVRTAKKGTFSSIDTDRILAQMKVRHSGGIPPATKYKKYLKSLGKATSSRFPANAFTAGKTALGAAQLKAHLKTKLPTAKVGIAKKLLRKTGLGKALAVATAAGAGYEAGKHGLLKMKKKKVQKKATGGEIIIGKGVDIDLL